MNDTFQLLVKTEGLNPTDPTEPRPLLWLGKGAMPALLTTAEALVKARIIPADAWSIACDGCHPRDTEEFLALGNYVIVKDEPKVALLIQALARAAESQRQAEP